MFNNPYYHEMTRKAVILFGSMFNEVIIERENSRVKVPLTYAPREKIQARLEQDPNLNQKFSMQFPLMSFIITGFEYSPEKQLNNMNTTSIVSVDKNKQKTLYQYAPYKIGFKLYVYARVIQDALQIVEMILPYFRPHYTLHAKLLPEMNENHVDIPVTLVNVQMTDLFDGQYEKRQMIVFELDFVMHYRYYGPVKEIPVIKLVTVNMFNSTSENIEDDIGNINPEMTLSITPGLTANGEPTSNSSLSIDRAFITRDDDYGFIVEINE